MAQRYRLGFVGAGNMATALIKGALESGVYEPAQIAVADAAPEARRRAESRFGIDCLSDNGSLVQDSAVVVLAVKPQILKGVIEALREDFAPRQLAISIAAGIPLKAIASVLGDIPLIRAMPNTPALALQGMTALAGGPAATPDHMATATALFESVGETVIVAEPLMDAVTAVSGSGPGYLFRIMECMVAAGVSVGLPEEIAFTLVVQTFKGAARLAEGSEVPLAQLRENVTSPGGTTAKGLDMLEELGLSEMIRKTVEAAYLRSLELGKET